MVKVHSINGVYYVTATDPTTHAKRVELHNTAEQARSAHTRLMIEARLKCMHPALSA